MGCQCFLFSFWFRSQGLSTCNFGASGASPGKWAMQPLGLLCSPHSYLHTLPGTMVATVSSPLLSCSPVRGARWTIGLELTPSHFTFI